MKVFYQRREDHTVVACPAGDTPSAEHPAEWLNGDGSPKVFPVRFVEGQAEVLDSLGRYLIDRGVARKTGLHWMRH